MLFFFPHQIVEKQRDKLYSKVPEEKRPKHRRLRVIEKEVQKRRLKYDEARLKATKVRTQKGKLNLKSLGQMKVLCEDY